MRLRSNLLAAIVLLTLAGGAEAEITGLRTSPAGANGDVQFNKRGNFGADFDFYYDTTTQTLFVPDITCPGCAFGGSMTPGASFYVNVNPASQPQAGFFNMAAGTVTIFVIGNGGSGAAAYVYGPITVDRPDLGVGFVSRSAMSFDPSSSNPQLILTPYHPLASSVGVIMNDLNGNQLGSFLTNPSQRTFSFNLSSSTNNSPTTRWGGNSGGGGTHIFFANNSVPIVQFQGVGNSSFTIPVWLSTITINKQMMDNTGSAGSLGYVWTSQGASSPPLWQPAAAGGSGAATLWVFRENQAFDNAVSTISFNAPLTASHTVAGKTEVFMFMNSSQFSIVGGSFTANASSFTLLGQDLSATYLTTSSAALTYINVSTPTNGAGYLARIQPTGFIPNSIVDKSSITAAGAPRNGVYSTVNLGAGTFTFDIAPPVWSLSVGTGSGTNYTNIVTTPTQAISFRGEQVKSLASGNTNFILIDTNSVGGIMALSTGTNSGGQLVRLLGNGLIPNSLMDNSSVTTGGQLRAGSAIAVTPTAGITTIAFSTSTNGAGQLVQLNGAGVVPNTVQVSSVGAQVLVSSFPMSGVTSGSYTNTNLTVNAQGIITAASNGSDQFVGDFVKAGSQTVSGYNVFTSSSEYLAGSLVNLRAGSTIAVLGALVASGGNGSAGQFLQSNGIGAAPSWATAAGTGDMVKAGTQTVSGFDTWTSSQVYAQGSFINHQLGSTVTFNGAIMASDSFGSSGQFLKSNGPNTAPTWASAGAASADGNNFNGYLATQALSMGGFAINNIGRSSSTINDNGIILSTIPTPTSFREGEIIDDNTLGKFTMYASSIPQFIQGTMYVSTGIFTDVNSAGQNVITSTSQGGYGTLTFPANSLKSGTSIHIYAVGASSTTGSPTLQCLLNIGTFTMCNSTARTMGTGVTDLPTEFEFWLTVASTGGQGTVLAQGRWNQVSGGLPSSPSDFMPANTGTKSLDTTVAQVLRLCFIWGTASSSNNLRITNFVVEVQ